MLGIEFLVRGAVEYGEPGVLMAFEETPADMAANVASLGFDIQRLADEKKLFLDFIYVEPSEFQETGEYDLEGLFLRLESAVKAVGAKRVMFDTIEALFSSFAKPAVLRAELRRLFRWLKERGLTAVVTAERGDGGGTLTRQGLEEYVSDCVILLDHRILDQISARRLRVVKYRGTKHGADEYPFLIDERGMSVLPLTSVQLQHSVTNKRVSSGVADLNEMLEGQGYYRGSTVLISGTAGSGKSTLAASFADAVCRSGERCLYIGFEESREQVERNMKAVGMDLERWSRDGLLHFAAWRPTQSGMEMHLLRIHKLVEEVKPAAVILDPITNLISCGSEKEVYSMLMRLIDYLKGAQITGFLVSLTEGGASLEQTAVGVSSLADTWIVLRDLELNGERNRGLHVLKSRGMAHSNQMREFVMGEDGIRLIPTYTGPAGVLTGSSRLSQEARDGDENRRKSQEKERRRQALEQKRATVEAQVAALQAELAAITQENEQAAEEERERETRRMRDTDSMAKSRGVRS